MGSAALAAAVPNLGKATQISCMGQRSTLVWHTRNLEKTRLQWIQVLTLLQQSWLDDMHALLQKRWCHRFLSASRSLRYHSSAACTDAVLPLKLVGLSQQRVEGFANPLPVGWNGGHGEGSNILHKTHTHTQTTGSQDSGISGVTSVTLCPLVMSQVSKELGVLCPVNQCSYIRAIIMSQAPQHFSSSVPRPTTADKIFTILSVYF